MNDPFSQESYAEKAARGWAGGAQRPATGRSGAPRHTLHRLPEGRDLRFDVVHQGVGQVRQLVVLPDQPACGVARVLRPPADFGWDERAGEEVLAKARGQVGAAARAQMGMVEEVGGQLFLPEALVVRRARHDGVAPAEHEEQSALLVVQLEGSVAVEVNDLVPVERNRIAERDRLRASRASRYSHGVPPGRTSR